MKHFLLIALLFCIVGFTSCEKPDREGPTVDFTIEPRFGDSLTIFHFDASMSEDNTTDQFKLKKRWDINADGTWESDFSINSDFAYRFPHNGTFVIKCEVKDIQGNFTSVEKILQVQPVPRDSTFTDNRDGKSYKAVFLFDRWWMRENLNYGQTLQNGESPRDNSVAEKYNYPDSLLNSKFGGFYSRDEATDYGRDLINGICPEGWRLPTINDINKTKEILWFTEDYTSFLSDGGSFMLDLHLSGKYIMTAKTWHDQHFAGNFWINHEQAFKKFLSWGWYSRFFQPYGIQLLSDYNPLTAETVMWQDSWGYFTYQKVALPIRCVKDHEIF